VSTVETERVLVVPTDVFHNLGHFHGFREGVDHYLDELLNPAHMQYRARAEMETDPSFKQLIPYVIFCYQPESQPLQLFHYTRGKGQGEARLRSKLSIGIGGHISACDHRDDSQATYLEGMRRELEEEVVLETAYRERVAGLINDDETDVGKVHLGVVHLFDVDSPNVKPRESEITEAGFRSVDELLDLRDSMESWSRICIEALFPCGSSLV
jgi:predicted NUDIX family phosphoesterase